MIKRLVFLSLSISLLFVFALFSRVIKQGALKDFDFAVTIKLQDRIPSRFDRLWEIIALGGSPLLTSIIVVGITLRQFHTQRKTLAKLTAFLIPFGFFFVILAEIYGKTVVAHPSPFFFLVKNVAADLPKYYIQSEFSYPSGHAARSSFIATLIYLLVVPQNWKRRLFIATLSAGYILAVALAKIYLGHHWFSDVLGGGTLGIAFALFLKAML